MDLTGFAQEVGESGPVAVIGTGTRAGGVAGVRSVRAPAGVDWFRPEEMTVCCGAGTPVVDVLSELASAGQTVSLPPSGTVGGALATGHSSIRRLGEGPIRDTVLQARYVGADGRVVTAGGPTVKNVSGFDLCRLLVGSRGTLGFLGDVVLRTRPLASHEQWYLSDRDPDDLLTALYRPVSVLWDGSSSSILLAGHRDDVEAEAGAVGLSEAEGPPELPTAARWSVRPSEIGTLIGSGRFVAEVGVGVVHHDRPAPPRRPDPAVIELHRRIKARFDPSGRLNPGVDVLDP